MASSPCNERDLTLMQVLLSSPREKLAFGRLFIHHRCFSFSFFLFALVRIRKTRFQDRLTGTKGRNGRKQEGIKVGGARKDLPCAASICMEIWDDWSLPVFPKSLLFCILLQYAASRIALRCSSPREIEEKSISPLLVKKLLLLIGALILFVDYVKVDRLNWRGKKNKLKNRGSAES